MNMAFRKQGTQYSRVSNFEAQTQGVGVFTPVHIQDIVKDRNLDYLQSLGQLVQKFQVNPVWYESQNNQNKMKFLQVYQLSISYARNTQDLYNQILNELDQQFQQKKNKLSKLKSQVLNHKQKAQKLKRQYRKQRLNKQKQKVLNYQKNMIKIRDRMLLQKQQLLAKNQLNFTQYEKNKKNMENNQNANPFDYIQQQPGFAYPPQSFAQYYPFPFLQQSPINTPHGQSPKNYNMADNNDSNHVPYFQKPNQNYKSKPSNKNQGANKNNDRQYFQSKADVPKRQNVKQVPDKQKSINSDDHFLKGDSIMQENEQVIQPKQDVIKKQDIKQKIEKGDNIKNTTKSYSFQHSGNIRSSNFDSEKGDEVKDLNSVINDSNKKNIIQSKLSNKSIDLLSDADFNSIMDIQLKTQSKNQILDQKTKANNLSKQASINQQINKRSGILKKKSSDQSKNESNLQQKKEKKSQKKQELKIYNDRMSIKISDVKQTNSPEHSKKMESANYLQKSNQGILSNTHKTDSLQIKHNLKLKLKQSNKLGYSQANSLQDVQIKTVGTKSNYQDEVYEDDFDGIQQPHLTQNTRNTRVKINVDYSDQSHSAQRFHQFVPLYKNYFIRKQEVKDLGDSSVSGIGSLKQLSVKFIGSQRRKNNVDKSHGGPPSQSDNLQLIEMPENSMIAKPSKLKKSTIHRSTKSKIIRGKLANSHDSKIGQFNIVTPDKTNIKAGQKTQERNQQIDDNFKIIDTMNLQSKKLTKLTENTLKVPKQPQQALRMSITESHVIQQQRATQQRSSNQQGQLQQSIKLSIIPQSQNQSRFTQNSNKNKIYLLIQKKYSQKGQIEVDKNMIKHQIQHIFKSSENNLSWEQLIEKVQGMSKQKQIEINNLKQERRKKFKDRKDEISNKIPNKLKSNTKIKVLDTKSNQKLKNKEQDDLNYSQSMVQNNISERVVTKNSDISPRENSQKPISHKVGKVNENKVIENKSNSIKQNTKQKSQKINNPKSDANARLLNKIIQASSYDKDDQLQNTITANFKSKNKQTKSQDSDDF